MALDIQAIRDRMAAAKKNFQRAGQTYKIKPGKNRFVILPPFDGLNWFRNYGQHYVKTEANGKPAVAVCPARTHNKPCDICDALAQVSSTVGMVDPQIKELVKESSAGQRFIIGVLALDSPTPAQPEVIEVGAGTLESIYGTVDAWLVNVFNPTTPQVIQIERTGTGLNTSYTVTALPETLQVPQPLKPINLDEWVGKGENENSTERAISAVRVLALGSGPRTVNPGLQGQGVGRPQQVLAPPPADDFDDVDVTTLIPTQAAAPAPVQVRPQPVQQVVSPAKSADLSMLDDIEALLKS